MIPIPRNRPLARRELVTKVAQTQWQESNPKKPFPGMFVLGVRSYYDTTIGPAGNEINAYDDAFFIVSPDHFSGWNGNTDPTRYGWNAKAGKYMARLRVGCWRFIRRMHAGKYMAFGQGESPVTVDRIDEKGKIRQSETGCFGIDLHLGGVNGTSSEGCNTVPPDQWQSFYKTLSEQIKLLGYRFDFILIDGPIN